MHDDEFLAALGVGGDAFVAAVEGNLDRPVPACPDWDVAGLVAHLGRIYDWVSQVVAAQGEPVGPQTSAAAPDDRAALIEWYRGCLAGVVEALSVDPATPAWTFMAGAPSTVGWWRRRQALETAVHRWDAQAASGTRPSPGPVPADLAVAGVDEYLTQFLPRALARRPVEDLTGTFHVHATDEPGEWWLDLSAEVPTTRREHAKADTAVRGPASGLYLWLWNRLTPEAAGLEVFGRRQAVDAWQAVKI
jgi:uncharacterized protein (TIGR03083 family)